MRKYILALVAVFATFMISACGGGGSSVDTTTAGTPAVPSNAVDLVEAGAISYSTATTEGVTALAATEQNFSVQVWYRKNLNDNYLVKVYTDNIIIKGCTIIPGSVVYTPNPVVMDKNTNSIAQLTITGKVEAVCTNETDYTLTGKTTVQLGDTVTEEVLSVSSGDVNNPTNPDSPTNPTTEYILTNPSTPITVNYNNEIKDISAYVVDANGVGVSGQTVSIQALNGVMYGSIISAATVQSDASGKVSFVYQAPSDVQAVDGNITTIDLLMTSDGIEQRQTIKIVFNTIDQNLTKPIVVIDNQYKDINLTSNSQSVTMEVRVFEEGTNTPYTEGVVKVKLPSKVLDGVDVGTFSEYSADVGSDGIAAFTYTGPRDLWELVNNGDENSTFQFYHEDNSIQNESITVHYEPAGSYQPTQYILSVTSSDGNNTMNLNSQKSFVVELKDDQGNLIDSDMITELNITTENTQIGILVDETTGNEQTKLTYSDADAVNPKSFHVKTSTLSGIVPIEVKITFTDANGNVQTLEKVVNVVVFSGPPTAMSIVYAGVEHNETIAKFIEKFVVTVTDAYSNPVNTRPYISTGAMVEYAVDGSSANADRTTTSPRLWHGNNDSHAELHSNGVGEQPQLNASEANVFQYVDLNNDKVVVFGAGYVYESLGKWDIENRINGQELLLKDNYFGSSRDDLFYAVGHNNRQDLCSNDGREYVGNMRSNTYQLDESGHAFIEFEYDYHLTGKDIMVWVNLLGFQADNGEDGRIGEAQKHTLRGTGFVSYESYTIASGEQNVTVAFNIHHKDVSEWYRNGHFATAFEPTACTIEEIVDSSNHHDARDCNNTVGYIVLNVSNNTTDDCTIKLKDESIAVSSEFDGVTYP